MKLSAALVLRPRLATAGAVGTLVVLALFVRPTTSNNDVLRSDALADTSQAGSAALGRHASEVANSTEPAAGSNPPWPIPLGALTITKQRPVFVPSRRPPPAFELASRPRPQSPGASPPKRPLLTLVGVIVAGQGGIAVLFDPATKGILRLRTGEGHAGWTLRVVTPQDATLQRGADTATLALQAPFAH